jgi:hypothetical protein
MTPTLDPRVLDFLARGDLAVSASVGLVVLGVLLVALAGRVLLEGATAFPRRDALRLLGIVVVPLLVVFVAIVVERFLVIA